jgi:putative ABC transport system permease protein
LAGEASTSAKMLGVDARYRELVTVELAEGRFLDAEDQRRHAQVAVIGADVRRALFGAEAAVGRFLKADDLWLEVIGVLAPVAAGGKQLDGVDLGSASTAIYAPLSTVQRKLEHDPLDAPLSELIVRLTEGTSPRTAAAHIAKILDTLHGGVDDTEMVVPEALLAESQRTQRLFNLVMGCIAGISLLVGGIGIMNIMLASVLERTEEIGVRRAVGARREDIRFQFALSSFGGLAGVVMGIVIARVVAASAGWPTVVTLGSVVLAAGVALVVGVTSGLYPAIRAANLDPIESLRAE